MKLYPLIKLVIVFILGIILQHYIDLSILLLSVIAISGVLILLFLLFIKSNQFLLSIVIFISVLSLSGIYYQISENQTARYPFEKLKLKKSVVFGEITEIHLIKKNYISFETEVDSIKNNGIAKKNDCTLLCKIYENNYSLLKQKYNELSIGNKITAFGTIAKGRTERNPGEFNYQNYLEHKGINGLLTVYNLNDVSVKEENISFINNTIFMIRKFIDNQIDKNHNQNAASLLRGLLLADRSKIDYDVRIEFVNAGVIHVLAVSGLHVGYILLIFLLLTNRFNLYLRLILTIVGLIFFLILTGHPPSVFRATIMAITLILAFLSGRSYNNTNALALAALILLLIDPTDLFNPGFQLSFSAVLSIILLLPIFKRWIGSFRIKSKTIEKIFVFATVSLAAQIGTLPFTLIYFGKLSLVSLFVNLLVIPLIGIILGIGIFTLLLSLFSPLLANMYASVNNLFSDLLFFIVEFAGSLSFAFVPIQNFSAFDGLVFYLCLVFYFYSRNRFTGSLPKLILPLLLLFNFYFLTKIDNSKLLEDGKLSILMVDVGQGDGILIKFPNGNTALLDAGDANQYFDTGERTLIPLLQKLEIGKIDFGFISHMDTDHYKGFEALVKKNLISKIYKPKLDSLLERDIKFEAFLKEYSVEINYYSKTFLDFGNTRLYILNDTNDVVYNSLDVNNKSGIFKLVHGKTSILFVGDAEKEAEKNLVNRYKTFLKSDVLKAGHHGSKTSSIPELLNFTKPDQVLISAGIENKFNHPSHVVLDRFNQNKIDVFRTDNAGAILLTSDGEKFEFVNWRNE